MMQLKYRDAKLPVSRSLLYMVTFGWARESDSTMSPEVITPYASAPYLGPSDFIPANAQPSSGPYSLNRIPVSFIKWFKSDARGTSASSGMSVPRNVAHAVADVNVPLLFER